MNRRRLQPTLFTRIATVFATVALVLRVLIPSGYMLAASSDPGAVRIVICTGQGPMMGRMAADGRMVIPGDAQSPSHSPDKSPDKNSDHPCIYGAAAAAAVAPTLAIVTAAPGEPVRAIGPVISPWLRPGLSLAAPPPPKTGPPILI